MFAQKPISNFHTAEHPANFLQIQKTDIPSLSTALIVVASVIFFSIVPYASAAVWSEAVVLIVIFTLGAVTVFRGNQSANADVVFLSAPFSALAFYSFVQGLLTLLAQNGFREIAAALPFSFDSTASIWSAAKFLALAILIKIILSASRRQIKFLIWSLIFTGNFFAVGGIVRFALQSKFPQTFGWFLLPDLRPGIGFGTFINQNHFAFLMLMNLGLNIGVCIYGGLEKNIRRLLFIFCLITWTAIILTASRGGIVSSFAVVGAAVLLPTDAFLETKMRGMRENYQSKFFSFGKRLASFAVLIIALVFGIALIGQDRVVQRFEEIPAQLQGATDAYGFQRVDVWRATAKMIGDYPFYGVGFGGFRVAVSQYIEISGAVVPREAHNDYLEFIAGGGAVAALCAVWFLYVFWRSLKRSFSEPSTPFLDAARIGAIGAFAGIAVHNFFDFSLHLIGNQLFLTALLSVAVHRPNADTPGKSGESLKGFLSKSLNRGKPFYAIFLLCVGVFSGWFGCSRLENALAGSSFNQSFAQNATAKIPFDADFYETKAFINENSGNVAAAENLQRAIDYLPKDFSLRLRLARFQQSQNQFAAAENTFREAIQLAPHYGEPHFYYGNFLVAANRKAEGFAELRFASQRRPQYFGKIVALAWHETKENAGETIKILSPLDTLEKEKLGAFLLEKKEYGQIAALVCCEDDATAMTRDRIIRVLLEKRQYFYAHQIYRRECDLSNAGENNLADGDFETGELYEGFGFGWRVADLPETIEIGLDEQTKSSGSNSLGFVFDGGSEPSLRLLSQITVVEKNRQYQLSFASRSEKIVTGGAPVLQLILKQTDGDIAFREIKLSASEGGWIKHSTAIQTGSRTEALEIRLTRQSCDQSLCPIFGRLWLDNFVLK